MNKAKKSSPLDNIAELAGVSKSTASIVLNGRGEALRISRATQDKVIQAAKSINYAPKPRNKRIASVTTCTGQIALFHCSFYTNEAFGRYLTGLQQSMEKNSQHFQLTIVFYPKGHLCDYKEQLERFSYEAVIIDGADDSDAQFISSLKTEYPIVISGQSVPNLSCVFINNYAIGKRCAQLFSDYGLQRLGIIGARRSTAGASMRLTGFMDGCAELGLELRPEWTGESTSIEIDSGYKSIDKIIHSEELPDALFVMTDIEAIGVSVYLKEHNLYPRFPLIVCGKNSTLQMLAPDETFTNNSIEALSEKTMDTAIMIINSGISAPISQVVDPEFVIGESLKRYKKMSAE